MRNIKASILIGSVVALAGCGADVYSESADGDQTDTQSETVSSTAQNLSQTTRFIVDRAADSTNGVCVANANSLGKCTLRAALAAAQQVTGPVLVELAADPVITEGQISVSGDVTIQPNAGVPRRSITGNATSRLFSVNANATLVLYKLFIQHFSAFDLGGAISNGGNLQIRQSILANNKAECSGGGAMTAFATCAGGAVWNTGTLSISEGSRFESNRVSATAYTASFTNASAGGGAISSTGSVVIRPPVAFISNSAVATAQSGFHSNMPGGAWANAGGGAISSSGSLTIRNGQPGSCEFLVNSAQASASAMPPGGQTAESAGGAISQTGQLTLPPACVFHSNSANVDPNVHITPITP